jgi:hypothetical protein
VRGSKNAATAPAPRERDTTRSIDLISAPMARDPPDRSLPRSRLKSEILAGKGAALASVVRPPSLADTRCTKVYRWM